MVQLPLEIVTLEEGSYHLHIKAQFDGLDNGWWIVDTGASKSVFDQSLVQYYHSEENPSIQASGIGPEFIDTSTAIIPLLRMGGYLFENVSVALIDFQPIHVAYARMVDRRVIGLIGADFLRLHKAVIDFPNLVLQLG